MDKKMKLVAIAFVFIMMTFLSACGGSEAGGAKKKDEKVLNLFNWAEYLPQEVIDQFEEETGIKVNYDAYSSNEEMMAKLQAGNTQYDIAVATTFFVDILLKQDLIQKMNKENIPNVKNLDSKFTSAEFDKEGDYFIPYLWGSGVLFQNTDLVDFEIKGYKDLFRPELKDKIVLPDDQRGVIGLALQMLGYSMNTTDEKELAEAKEKLLELRPNIRAFNTEPKTMMISGDVAAGMAWTAEVFNAQKENPAIVPIIPEEGLMVFHDNFVIPKGAPHLANAEKFIDFLLRPEISKIISTTYPYGNPNSEAYKLLPEDLKNNKVVYPDLGQVTNVQQALDIGEATQLYDRIYSELKAGN
ncbi:spermidine/putrescine ABC transporter substrate-binding protein [Bacillus sp. JJ1521]|uniref:ABC transporter substrate-binding protein n=1 Tax=Bacillus sp. JJ1521 TaxID=3122957 RepID=UPI002FFFFF4C